MFRPMVRFLAVGLAMAFVAISAQSAFGYTDASIQRQTWVDTSHWETSQVWVDTSHWETRQTWVDTSHWENHPLWVTVTTTQLQQRLVATVTATYAAYIQSGYWQWQYVPGYWAYQPGYWAYQPGYWTYQPGHWAYSPGHWSYQSGYWSYSPGGWQCGWSGDDWDGWSYSCWWNDGSWNWNDGGWYWQDGYWYWQDGYWYWQSGYWYWQSGYWYWVDGYWQQVWVDTSHWVEISRSNSWASAWENVSACSTQTYAGSGDWSGWPSSISSGGVTYGLDHVDTTGGFECQENTVTSGYWQDHWAWVSGGYWTTQQVWVTSGYWDTQRTWVTSGYWNTWTENLYTDYSGVTNGATYTTSVSPTLTGRVTPTSENIASLSYHVNGGAWTTVAGSRATFTETNPGPYSVEFYVTDTAGNRSALDSFSFTIQDASFCGPLTRQYPYLIWYGPEVGQPTQVLTGAICNAVPLAGQTVRLVVTDPNASAHTYTVTTDAGGAFRLDAASAPDADFGTTALGNWSAQAFLDAYSLSSNSVAWQVAWFIIHTTR